METPRASLLKPLLVISLIVAGIIFVVWGFPALMMLIFFRANTGERPIDLSEVARYSRLQFPSGTRLAGAIFKDDVMDYTVFAKVIMDKGALEEFKKQGFVHVNQQPPVFDDSATFAKSYPTFSDVTPQKIPNWWNPGAVKNGEAAYLTVQDLEDPKKFSDDWIAVLIDSSEGEGEVYLIAGYW
jgi:hypothetical protein